MQYDPIFEIWLAEADHLEEYWPLSRLCELDEEAATILHDRGLTCLPDEEVYSNIFDACGGPIYLERERNRGFLCKYLGERIWHAGYGRMRAESVLDVSPVRGQQPFTLAIPWKAIVFDEAGGSQAAIVTGWDGEFWITSSGRVRYVNAPVPMVRSLDDDWRV